MDHGQNYTLAKVSHLQQSINKKSLKLSNSPVKSVEFAQAFAA